MLPSKEARILVKYFNNYDVGGWIPVVKMTKAEKQSMSRLSYYGYVKVAKKKSENTIPSIWDKFVIEHLEQIEQVSITFKGAYAAGDYIPYLGWTKERTIPTISLILSTLLGFLALILSIV